MGSLKLVAWETVVPATMQNPIVSSSILFIMLRFGETMYFKLILCQVKNNYKLQ